MQLPAPPEGLDLTANRGPELIRVLTTTWCLAAASVGARVASRKLSKNKLWLDDWFIIASLIWSGALMFQITIYMVQHGFGKHVWAAPPDALMVWAIGLLNTEITYALCLVFVKWSILAFYYRIFAAHGPVKIPIWILFSVVCMWGLAVILVALFQCLPINAFWMRFDPDSPMPASSYFCGIDDKNFLSGNAIPNIITDLVIIALPVPYIWRLYLPVRQKLAITSVLIVGLFVTAVSIVRFTYILRADLQSPDITWNYVDIMLWTSIEGNIATICACLPSLKPIFNLSIHGTITPNTHRDYDGCPNGLDLVTIGGSREKNNGANEGMKWGRQTRLNPNAYGTSLSHVTAARVNKGRSSDAERPFAQLTDNDSVNESHDGATAQDQKTKDRGNEHQEDGIMVRKEVRIVSAKMRDAV